MIRIKRLRKFICELSNNNIEKLGGRLKTKYQKSLLTLLKSHMDKLFASFWGSAQYVSRLFAVLVVTIVVTACGQNEEAPVLKDKPDQTVAEINEKVQSAKLFAQSLKIQYRVVNNRVEKQCDAAIAEGKCFLAEFTLSIDEPVELDNWRIYFSFMTPVRETLSDQFEIFHVNGDLHYLQPLESFTGWPDNNEIKIPFKAAFWQISEFDLPPNFYLMVDEQSPIIIDSTRATINEETQMEELNFVSEFTDQVKQFQRTAEDKSEWLTAEKLFERNQRLNKPVNGVENRVIPKPENLQADPQGRTLNLSQGIQISRDDFQLGVDNPAIHRLQQLGVAVNSNGGTQLEIIRDKQVADDEGYRLNVTPEKLTIYARHRAGAFYAIQSINSLITPGENQLPLVSITDKPRFKFRGLHLDVARNFRDKNFILRLLDQMAAYKLNKLHLHLADDEGWRLEIPGLPELTQVGATRCHDLTEQRCLLPQLGAGPIAGAQNDGFYSVDDYQQILIAAKQREIEVIPSFDMPGHSRAAVKSMQARYRNFQQQGKSEQAEEFLLSDINDQTEYLSVQYYRDNTLNVCKASTYHFVETVLSEVIKQHQNAQVPMTTYHIGADETAGAWKDSPECQAFVQEHKLDVEKLSDYFVQRVAKFLAEKSIFVAGWSDGLAHLTKESMPEKVQVNVWTPLFWDGHKVAHNSANKEWRVVMSSPDVTYFDFPYEADPKERGYYWGTRFTNTRQVFEFMPENLPLHAEIWTDRENRPMELDDTAKPANDKQAAYLPMQKGKFIYGMQGHLWSEMVRSDATAEYMLFPRVIALAERAWHKAAWEPEYRRQGGVYSPSSEYFTPQQKQQRDADWAEFSQALALKEFAKLDKVNLLYRLPTLGGKVQDNKLFINSAFPGLRLEYQLAGGAWQSYGYGSDGVSIDAGVPIFIRAKSPLKDRAGRPLSVSNP